MRFNTLALIAILLLGAFLRVWRLDANGYGTEYYAAGVRSMLESWRLFFFNAFDPAGFVSLDKPPVAFWIQAASAWIFGFNGLSLLLPQAVEGLLSIAILRHLVRRRFGEATGLLAALFLAIMPVAVAVDRSNNTDSALVLFLLLAAWATLNAIERPGAWRIAAAMALAGVAFNVKMLVALGVVPALALAYFAAVPAPFWRRVAHLAAGGATLLVVSLSWVVIFDLVPADRRPYAGSSQTNSMVELVVGHNGIERFVRLTHRAPRPQPAARPGGAGAPAGMARLRMSDTVPVGPLRLADRHLAGQFAWLLPLAAIGAVFAARRTKPTWPLTPTHASLLLWSGWALTYGVVFSFAGGIFHAYYLAVLGPPVAALAAIGLVSVWSAPQRWAWPLALVATAAWQAYIGLDLAQGRVDDLPTLLLGALAIGTLLASLRVSRWAFAGLLALPIAWALSSALVTGNAMLPSASLGRVVAPFDQTRHTGVRNFPLATEDARLLAFLEANHGRERFALATPNARLAAPVIVRTGLPVMAFGGFMGTDPILAPDALRQMVERGEVRFVVLSGRGSFGLSPRDEDRRRAFIGWVRRNGARVEPSEWRGLDPWQDQRQPIGLYDLRPAAGLVRIAP
ncbi:MAG: glycosyltransferase family 39 protein [Reyranellaceae bacterium]